MQILILVCFAEEKLLPPCGRSTNQEITVLMDQHNGRK